MQRAHHQRLAWPSQPSTPVVWLLFCLHLLAQPVYALLPSSLVIAGTLVIVLSFTAFSLAHLAYSRGTRAALELLLLCVIVCGGLEVLSVQTGIPFGRYIYSGALGPGIFGVPFLVPLCWLMMAYPVIRLSELLAVGWWRIPCASLALTAWDLFLDPQIVRTGLWTWLDPGFYAGIPLQNYVGWLVTALLLFTLWFSGPGKNSQGPPRDVLGALPHLAYLWTWFGSTIVNLLWWNQPLVGLVGGIGMALFAIPMLLKLRKLPWLRHYRQHLS
jgi:uncharacterized membrane protein